MDAGHGTRRRLDVRSRAAATLRLRSVAAGHRAHAGGQFVPLVTGSTLGSHPALQDVARSRHRPRQASNKKRRSNTLSPLVQPFLRGSSRECLRIAEHHCTPRTHAEFAVRRLQVRTPGELGHCARPGWHPANIDRWQSGSRCRHRRHGSASASCPVPDRSGHRSAAGVVAYVIDGLGHGVAVSQVRAGAWLDVRWRRPSVSRR